MKVILYMAISLDGKITASDDSTDWVQESDIVRMDALMKTCAVMVMGRNTYDSFGDDLPTDQALQVVMTHDQNLLDKIKKDNLIITNKTPSEVVSMLDGMGYKEALLAGGETLNTSFLQSNLISEVRVIVKPLLLGKGKSLIKQVINPTNLNLKEIIKLDDGSVELHYDVQT